MKLYYEQFKENENGEDEDIHDPYIQSAYNLHDEDKVKQEENSLRHIGDFHKKIIITHEDIHVRRTESGITYMNIYDFFTPNSLEM